MQSPMQILQGRNASPDLSNAVRKQLGIQPEIVRNSDKHAVLPKHDLCLGQQVMYQDSARKCWYPAVIDSLCSEARSYKISTRGGIVHRKTQSPYSSLIFKYFKCLISENWIYSVFIVFTSVCNCPCNGIHAVQSCMHTCMSLNIK